MKPSSSHIHQRQAYTQLRRQAYDSVASHVPTQRREHSPPSHRQQLYNYPLPAASQAPPYLAHNPIAFSFQRPVTQQPGTILPSNTGALESPLPAQTPPSYSAALQATGTDSRSMQELLLEGDLSTDIDTLNPSLTDLQLHGKQRHTHSASQTAQHCIISSEMNKTLKAKFVFSLLSLPSLLLSNFFSFGSWQVYGKNWRLRVWLQSPQGKKIWGECQTLTSPHTSWTHFLTLRAACPHASMVVVCLTPLCNGSWIQWYSLGSPMPVTFLHISFVYKHFPIAN